MLLLNKTIKPSTKVWIYTSQSALQATQLEQLNALSQTFLNSWESHGAPVEGGIEILYNRFVVVYADDYDGHLCGRAQDAQVRFIKEIEPILGVSLMNRMLVAYKTDKGEVEALPMSEFSSYVKTIANNGDLTVFDNTITSIGEFNSKWETNLSNTWMARLAQ
jgi:hypothetical protein